MLLPPLEGGSWARQGLTAGTAFQELQQKRAQKASEAKRLAEEELAALNESRRAGRRKPGKPAMPKNGSPASRAFKANNAGEVSESPAHILLGVLSGGWSRGVASSWD